MTSSPTRTRLRTWAGLWLAALLWAVNMQLAEVLPTADCTRQLRLSAIISGAFAILASFAAYMSWRSTHARFAGLGPSRTLRFAAMLSALCALVFVFALLLQTTASLVLTGCER
jgi:formate hydrogenlyase subunit 4